MIQEVSREEVIGTAKRAMSLPTNPTIDETFVASLLRRAAAIHCPCSPTTLASSVRDSLRFLAEEGDALTDMIETCLEGLLIVGDLLELSQVSVDDPSVKSTWVFAGPPAFIMRTSGAAFVAGIF